MMGWTSSTHIIIIFLLLLLLFGAKRLPEIGRSLGTGMREFKNSVMHSTPAETQQTKELPPADTTTASPITPERKTV